MFAGGFPLAFQVAAEFLQKLALDTSPNGHYEAVIVGLGALSYVVFLLAFPYSETTDIDNLGRFLRNVIILGFGGGFCRCPNAFPGV